MALQADAARNVIEEKIARPMKISVAEAAAGDLQAAHDPETPLASLSESDQNRALVTVCELIGEAVAR